MTASMLDQAMASISKFSGRATVALERKQRESAPAATVRLIRGDAITLEPVRWLWSGFLPAGMLTILGGAPGCGKTTIALSLAATVTRGGVWPDGSRCTQAGDVLIWSGEDAPEDTLAPRLVAAGADMVSVHLRSAGKLACCP